MKRQNNTKIDNSSSLPEGTQLQVKPLLSPPVFHHHLHFYHTWTGKKKKTHISHLHFWVSALSSNLLFYSIHERSLSTVWPKRREWLFWFLQNPAQCGPRVETVRTRCIFTFSRLGVHMISERKRESEVSFISARPQTLSLSHHSTSIDPRTQWSPGTLALPLLHGINTSSILVYAFSFPLFLRCSWMQIRLALRPSFSPSFHRITPPSIILPKLTPPKLQKSMW